MRRLALGLSFAIAVGGLVASPEARATGVAFTGIRPGSWMASPSWCTMNFIFNATGRLEDGGPFYIGTAKHCVGSADPRGRSVVLQLMLGGSEPVNVEIGTVSHATKGATQPDRDWALVRIKPELEGLISPSMAIIGGPTSVYEDGSFDEPAVFTGNGLGIGTGGTPRLGRLTCSCPTDSPYAWGGTFTVIGGDSGSGIRTIDGAAVGLASWDAVAWYTMSRGQIPPDGTTLLGPRVTYVRDAWGLEVVTCASAAPWPGVGCPPL